MLSSSPIATEGLGSALPHLWRACMTAAQAWVTAMFSDRRHVPLKRSAQREKTKRPFGMSGTPESTVTVGIGYASGSARTERMSAKTSSFASVFDLADAANEAPSITPATRRPEPRSPPARQPSEPPRSRIRWSPRRTGRVNREPEVGVGKGQQDRRPPKLLCDRLPHDTAR